MGRIANVWGAALGRTPPAAPAPTTRKRRTQRFAAAGVGRLRGSFAGSTLSADESINRSLRKVRARSRELAQDNEYMKRFLQLVGNNVVGPNGVIFQSQCRNPDGSPDGDNPLLEAIFAKQCKRGNFDVTGLLSRTAAEQIIIQQVARDGEILIRLRRNFPRNAMRYATQLLDPDLLDEELNTEMLPGGGRIRMGVEQDPDGRPVAYHLLNKHPGERFGTGGQGLTARHTRFPASEILHLFVPYRAQQTRGMPWAHAAILALSDLGGYREAAIIAARIGASKLGWFKGDEYEGDDTDADGNVIIDAQPGTFGSITGDDTELVEWDPDYPHEQFEAFNKAMLRGVAGGLGVAYNGFANDLQGVNFSSIRTGVLDERDAWMVVQNWLIESYNDPLYADWFFFQLMRGGLGSIPFERRDLKCRAGWQPKRWSWVDPKKDVEANSEAVGELFKSTSQVIRETGRDPDEVYLEIAADQARWEELGIAKVSKAQTPSLPAPSTEVDENEEAA